MRSIWMWYAARHRLVQIWLVAVPLAGAAVACCGATTGFGSGWPWYLSGLGGAVIGWLSAQVGRYVSEVARTTRDFDAVKAEIDRMERGGR